MNQNHYLFKSTTVNGFFVIAARNQEEATDYVKTMRMSGTLVGPDNRTPREQWDSQAVVYNSRGARP